MTKFEMRSEEDKTCMAFHYAMMRCQDFLFNKNNMIKSLHPYRKEVEAMADWLAKKQGMEGVQIYPIVNEKDYSES